MAPPALCPEDPEERARLLRAQLASVPANRRTEVLQALSLVWRSRGQLKSKRLGDAALALAALLLEGGLASLAAGANGADPGALLLGLVEAAGRGQSLLWGARREAVAERETATKTSPINAHHEEGEEPNHEERLDRRAALAKLAPRDRWLLERDAAGQSARDIAHELGVGREAAKKAIQRAKFRLEKNL